MLDRLSLIFEDRSLVEKLAKEASNAVDHLNETGALYRAIDRSQLPDHTRRKYAEKLAVAQGQFLRSTRFFATVQQAIEQAPQRIVMLLEICGQKALIEKDNQRLAESTVADLVSTPKFINGYLAESSMASDRAQALGELKSKLSEAGFDPEALLKLA